MIAGLCAAAAGAGQCADEERKTDTQLPEVVVRGEKTPMDRNLPAVSEGITAAEIAETVNTVNTEDAMKYLPSLHIRKRYIGDRNSIVASRSSGTQVSARALVYSDGLLLSNLLGNSFGFPPRWSLVSPEEIERIDVIYGPFSAAYPGNSMGTTIHMTTRLPETFEAHVRTQGFRQDFKLYGTDEVYGGSQISAVLGNRHDKLTWFAGVTHLDSRGQPMTFATSALSTTPVSGGETVVSGAHRDLDPNGSGRVIFGATGIDHTVQDNFKVRMTYDVTPALRASYLLGYWRNDSDVSVQSYLRDAAGNPVYSGNVDIDGYRYTLGASAFQPSKRVEEHWMHGFSLKSDTRGEWNFETAVTYFNFGKDEQRSPSTALPAADSGGAGRIALADGNGWRTFDLKADWRPGLDKGRHEAVFGYHYDRYTLDSRVFNTDNWLSGGLTTRVSAFAGNTETQALFIQDAWRFAPDWKLTLGGRYEIWSAFGGATSNATTTVYHNERTDDFFSPKAALNWQATPDWLLRASLGRAYRMPTVSELFQGTISAGAIVNNDPNLKPEKALSGELTAERSLGRGLLRLTLFQEDADDALYSQTNTTVFPTVTNIQNIDRVRTRGVEAAFRGKGVGVRGLDLSASITYADSEILKNDKFPASVGKRQPRVPDWRASAVATWHQDASLSYTLAARYSGRQYNTLDNTDSNPDTYGGTSRFFVADVRVNYKFARRFTASAGVDNLNNREYYAYHPYPQRTFHGEMKFDF
ncbi:MAG: TonB-dependent receptor [Candidatus Muproteobacteria bacterium RBG_16_62_13]|uniref:TonB-dependent receptor n=1 Tax=Candidatus Muproteobacteria bacterium RBG_16_62_13 TaxID=1817756 RepID=A0A1F6T3X3_9PROT|nr:MAG: TonB-dependent receptor [Candidatus Muproteobacteria bacterium RBG_16_62_13]